MKFRDSRVPIDERVQDLLSRLTVDEKVHMLSTHHHAVPRLHIGEWYVGCEVARGFVSKNPEEPSTVFPQPIGMASTFDAALMHKIGMIASDEARHYYQKSPNGRLMLWGPTVDPERDPRWGRTEEGYGEDPFLIGEMTKAYTKGLVGSDPFYWKTVPTLKHFCANNNEKDRGCCSANVTPRTLHEYYYEAFRASIEEGGAHSIMAAYNELNGVPACMNPDLQSLVKDAWGLNFIVTDGGDFSQNVLSHHSHKTHAEAMAVCLKNGTDTFTDPDDMVAAAAYDGLRRGLFSESDIDKAIGNVLAARMRLGEFDEVHPYKDMLVEVDGPASRAVNQRAAMEQVCLLKNDGILPLPQNSRIAVIGPIADENYRDWYTGIFSYAVSVKQGFEQVFGAENVVFDNGYDIVALQSCKNGRYLSVNAEDALCASSHCISKTEQFEWHDWDFGSWNYKACCNQKYVSEDNGIYCAVSDTPYEWFIREWFKPEALEQNVYRFHSWHDNAMDIGLDENNVLSLSECTRPTPEKQFRQVLVEDGVERAAALAKKADYAVVCLGNHPMQVARECYDRPSLALPTHQQKLVQAVYDANPRTILLLVSSYPYAISKEQETLPAIVYTTHAGAELGTAVAKTFSGENNPAARCPITWYRSEHELPDIMDYDLITQERTYLYYTGTPLYPFGHGLSYSKFRYSDYSVKPVYHASDKDSYVQISVLVENSSDLDGDEVVQVYFRHEDAPVKRPQKQLCAFERVHIKARNAVRCTFSVPLKRLAFYDVTRERMCTTSGMYTFFAGGSSADLRVQETIAIQAETIPPLDLSLPLKAIQYREKGRLSLDFSYLKNDWYVYSTDWGGMIQFHTAVFCNYQYAEIQAAAPCSSAKLLIGAGNTNTGLLGTAVIMPSAGKDAFETIRIPLKPFSGCKPLCIQIEGMVNLYRIQFYYTNFQE